MADNRTLALVSYIEDNTQCSYTEFLNLNRNVVLSSQPFSKEWNVLDLTWARRFLKKAKELKEYDYATIEKEVKKQCANKGLQNYWETIIYEREKMEAQRAHLTGSMRVYSKVAERNSEILSSEDYSNIFSSNASVSPGIEPETDVSENEEDSGISNLDTPDHEETNDDQEIKEKTNYKANMFKENKGPVRMSEENREEFMRAYKEMDKKYMWKLSSGRIVEEELYKLGLEQEFEHAIHSFILDVEDELIMDHFTGRELEEIGSATIPEVPELSNEIDGFLGKFLGKTNLNEIRQTIKESMFGNDYNREKHHDIDYICLALYSLVREIENGNLKNTNLENWYNCHIWNIIFDQAFGDIKAVAVVRGESTSISTAIRKNKKAKRKAGERRKIGRRGDWILRAVGNGNKDEFGAGEAGKDWTDKFGTKYLKEIGLKLPKTLKDMLMNLMERINWIKEVRKNIQTVGIIHEGLMMSLVYADNPKGYICRFRRSDLMEVPDTAEKFDSILMILASVLNAKSAIRETIKIA
ncbi:C2H2-type zinc finger transcription factor [Rhizophagus clarus]|uniref:C2H2-type zinc finger transcription factor n=1 Tax=Rhizophagus clarus TaxID=94130 RepID=A0A8H3LPU9_9GLOM|nr:C2H2-type zinc finger transcription factor [Rhizophagus clarus]